MKSNKVRIILGCDPLLMPFTGIGHYTKQLGDGLRNHDDIDGLKLFAHGMFFSNELLCNSAKLIDDVVPKPRLDLLSKMRLKLSSTKTVVKLYQMILPHLMRWSLRGYSDYIFHSPNFSLPPFAGKTVVTLHDLSTLRFPEYHPAARAMFVNKAISEGVEYADHIITDSEFVKNEIIQLYGVSADKVTAIPLGADSSFYARSKDQCKIVLAENALEYKGYFLFVSTLEPRKNLHNLLDAYCLYREKSPNGLPLILVGNRGWNSDDIHERVKHLEAKGWVKYLGYVSQCNIPVLYAAARALLFPSIYEGFGLPVLEAMQSGAAVLTSENSAMSEIASDCAVLTDKDDVQQMGDLITRLAEDEHWVEEFSRKGLQRATNFSWDQCVSATALVYQGLSV